jgi:hypothetical protein
VPSTSFYEAPQPAAPFRPGAVVIATLANPREKIWGAILHLSPTGLSLRGVDLSSFDDFVSQIRDGEPFAAGVLFFPMHRVERLELDLPEGTIPSLAQRFAQKTGQDPAPMLVSEFLPSAIEHAEKSHSLAGPSETRPSETNVQRDSGKTGAAGDKPR